MTQHRNNSIKLANTQARLVSICNWMSEKYVPGLVSVIIPTYNRNQLIVETIDSVFAQTYRPIELIVVDDGSTDNTRQVLQKWQESHSRDEDFLIQLLFQENKGAPVARNLGAAKAQGEYIQFFDSDDIMFPKKLEKQITALRTNQVDFVACDLSIQGENKSPSEHIWKFSRRPHDPTSHILNICLNTHSPVFMRNSLITLDPWVETLKVWQDFEFTFRILATGLRGLWLPEVLYSIRHHEDIEKIGGQKTIKNYESLLEATMRTEQTAIYNGICDKHLLDAIGRRLATMSRILAMEGEWDVSGLFFRQAISRLKFKNRIIHSFHRYLMRILGSAFMKKQGWM